jgi:hypothetical protein
MDGVRERDADGMGRPAIVDASQLVAPPCEQRRRIAMLVVCHVVDEAAEGVDGVQGGAALRREQAEGGLEVRPTAPRGGRAVRVGAANRSVRIHPAKDIQHEPPLLPTGHHWPHAQHVMVDLLDLAEDGETAGREQPDFTRQPSLDLVRQMLPREQRLAGAVDFGRQHRAERG